MKEKFPVEDFIKQNGLKLAWFSTSTMLIKGYIGARIENETSLTLDIIDCEIFCIKDKNKPLSQEKIKMTLNIKDIQSWGLA